MFVRHFRVLQVIFSAACLSYTVSAQEPLENEQFRGKVRLLKVDVYTAVGDSGMIKTGPRGTEYTDRAVIRFDHHGRTKERKYYTDSKHPFLWYQYFCSGHALPDSVIRINSIGRVDSKIYHKYDDQGRLTASFFCDRKGQVMSKEIKQYNESGLLFADEYYQLSKLQTCTEYSYDSKGRVIQEKIILAEQNNAVSRVLFEYDASGLNVAKITIGTDSIVEYVETSVKDSTGRLLERTIKKGSGTLYSHTRYVYDPNGNIIWWSLQWGPYGTPKIHSMQYKYDRKKNWVQKTVYIDGKPSQIVIRKIRY